MFKSKGRVLPLENDTTPTRIPKEGWKEEPMIQYRDIHQTTPQQKTRKSSLLVMEEEGKEYDFFVDENNAFFQEHNIRTPKHGAKRSDIYKRSKSSMEKQNDLAVDIKNLKTSWSTTTSPQIISDKQKHDEALEKLVSEAQMIRKQRQAALKMKEYKQKELELEWETNSPVQTEKPFSGAISHFEKDQTVLSRQSSRANIEWLDTQMTSPTSIHQQTPSLEPIRITPQSPTQKQKEDDLQKLNYIVNSPTHLKSTLEVDEIQYIPVHVAKEKIMNILKDWTAMKINYLKSLDNLRDHYQRYDEKDEEQHQRFVQRFKEKYNKLKHKFTNKRKEVKKLMRELNTMKETNMMLRMGGDGSMDEMIIEQITLKQKVETQKKLFFGLLGHAKRMETQVESHLKTIESNNDSLETLQRDLDNAQKESDKEFIQELKMDQTKNKEKLLLRQQAMEELKEKVDNVTSFAKEQTDRANALKDQLEVANAELEAAQERIKSFEEDIVAITPNSVQLESGSEHEDVPKNKIELDTLQRALFVEKQLVQKLKDEVNELKLHQIAPSYAEEEETTKEAESADDEGPSIQTLEKAEAAQTAMIVSLQKKLEKEQKQVKIEHEQVVTLKNQLANMERDVLDTEGMMEIQRNIIEKDAMLDQAQKQFKKLQSAYLIQKEKADASDETIKALEDQLVKSQGTSTNAGNELKKLAEENQTLHETENKNLAQLEEQQALIDTLKEEKSKLRDAVIALKPAAARSETLKKALKKFSLKYEDLNKTYTSLQEKHDVLTQNAEDVSILREEKKALEMEAKVAVKRAKEAKKKEVEHKKQLLKEQSMRRHYYNQLEDAKGKIRVYCRVRPFSKKEKEANFDTTVEPIDEAAFRLIQKNKKWEFSRVFYEEASQAEVYQDTSDLIQSVFDGYNVCVFAYGQTGSGKTYTISGVPDDPIQRGILPRSIHSIFETISKPRHAKLYETTISSTMVELYLDEIYDLYTTVKKKRQLPDYQIKKDRHNNVIITNVRTKKAESSEELFKQYTKALSKRHVRATKMNAESSRSHLIFSILIESKNKSNGETTYGKLSLVDLAGSEKSSKTGVDEMGAREAIAINKSLSALKDVIISLCEQNSHVPYRSNKLTMLLSDSLGGVAKTLMFVNVGPAEYNLDETNNSLLYADRVKSIKNNVTKNQESKKVRKLNAKLKKMQSLVDYLKTHGGAMPADMSLD